MVYIGIDDTDIVGSPGTNQLARAIVKQLGSQARGAVICRHQLFFDRRVPYTSKNGSASIVLPHATAADSAGLIDQVRDVMCGWFIEGSDPGLCVTPQVPPELHGFGRRCQREVVEQDEARGLAADAGAHLEGLGGTEQGVIGALAAVGLAATGQDGRVVHLDGWPYPDDFCGAQDVAAICARGVDAIHDIESQTPIAAGLVDVGKHLRPNMRDGRVVMFVAPAANATVAWQAVKLT